jgi:hypothetical protein
MPVMTATEIGVSSQVAQQGAESEAVPCQSPDT